MDFIDEVDPTSLDDQKNEMSVELIHEIYDEFSAYLSCEDEESDDYRLVQFGVGGPA